LDSYWGSAALEVDTTEPHACIVNNKDCEKDLRIHDC
jgi:hypothetical protein